MEFFGFMDETGVLSNDPKQPYFALGLLRLKDTSKLLHMIMAIKAKHKGIIIANNARHKNISEKEDFDLKELKFSSLKTKKFLPLYEEIIKTCLSYEYFYFSTFVIEKSKIKNKETIWDTYLTLAKAHINQHCKDENKIAILADYLTKPKDGLFFEDEMKKLKRVFNACMLESDASIFIQLVDIFIGAIVYRYKKGHNLSKNFRNPKIELVRLIEKELMKKRVKQTTFRGNLDENFTIFGDKFYFSVYEK